MALVIICSCEKNEPVVLKPVGSSAEAEFRRMENIEFTKADESIAASVDVFGINLFNEIASENTADNVVISPVSASIALAMTANGAKGRTLSQITEALGLNDFSKDALNRYFCKTVNTLMREDESCSTKIANSAWVNEYFSMKEAFRDSLVVNYDAEIENVDFGSMETAGIINRWVKEHTGGLIEKMVDETDGNIALMLINALYYSGRWEFSFNEDDVKATFHAVDGDKTCTMLNVRETFNYYEDDEYQVLELGYANGRQCFDIYLPKNEGAKLNPEYVTAATEKLMPETVSVKLPPFRLEGNYEMIDALKALGIGDLFDGSAADLSDIGSGDLFVSRVKQKVYMDVSKEGTTAGAATEVDFREKAVTYIDFTADHPFFFILRDKPSKTILFIGQKVR